MHTLQNSVGEKHDWTGMRAWVMLCGAPRHLHWCGRCLNHGAKKMAVASARGFKLQNDEHAKPRARATSSTALRSMNAATLRVVNGW
jgi:hypothetical protein